MDNNNRSGKNDSFVTIMDIARRADVSKATVSRVINGYPGIRESTKRKVQQVMAEANYSPSALARGLASNKSNTLSVIVPDILNPYYSEIIKSIEMESTRNGFDLFLCITNEQPGRAEYFIRQMVERRTVGLIILSTKISNKELLDYAKRRIKLVAVEADIPDIPHLGVENELGTERIVDYLIDLGHRDIAFLGYNYDLSAIKSRLAGYKRALIKANIPVKDACIYDSSPLGDPGYNMMRQLIAGKNLPTAVHCMNEYVAAGAMRAVHEAKMRIPEDISISGFDNLQISRLLHPGLTTVDTSTYELGKAATEVLIKSIDEDLDQQDLSIRLPATLVVRESTARLARAASAHA